MLNYSYKVLLICFFKYDFNMDNSNRYNEVEGSVQKVLMLDKEIQIINKYCEWKKLFFLEKIILISCLVSYF